MFNNDELIDIINYCTNIDKKVIEKEIIPIVRCSRDKISFMIRDCYYKVNSRYGSYIINIYITNDKYIDDKVVQECLLMNVDSQQIIDNGYVYYYISLPAIRKKVEMLQIEKVLLRTI